MRLRLFALLLLAAVSSPVEAGIFGRYLDDAPFTFGTTTIDEYGHMAPTEFDRNVVDPMTGLAVGTIMFDYDTFDANTNTLAGAALAGGFFQDAGVRVKDGFSLAWAQTVLATNTGANDWNLPATGAGRFPDAGPASPRYPFESLDVTPVGAAPTLAYTDDPFRLLGMNTNQSWSGELGLVAISNTANIAMMGMDFREVRVIGTFVWGFDIVNTGGAGPYDVTTNVIADPAPLGWGAPTQDYLDTFNGFYDGMGGGGGPANGGAAVASTKYKLTTGQMVFVAIPEPSTIILILVGVMMNRRQV